ncbi:hypothetical protein GDO81_014065 [Engystomops pustulosus]|uniref:Multiple epidermal growth factor-like domains protein 6 n=1 Tax=Engystomops pustulosus TaxID=76066 RepID=A0AAV7B7Q2_ENGPU|nr:hypothetical protein GDO81_014065 [Engystomops pustulosus]
MATKWLPALLPLHMLGLLLMFDTAERCLATDGTRLQSYMPNVCPERELTIVAHKQPVVEAYSRMVKVWKQGCAGQMWCVGYERRTAYYTSYRQVYSREYQTVNKCCPGWSQLNGETGCQHSACNSGVCFNGGNCVEGSSQRCICPAGFQGPRCQYGRCQ